MPEPAWVEEGLDLLERPHIGAEILGRGPNARSSKTFLNDGELSSALSFVRGYATFLLDLFRELHARTYTVEVRKTLEDGTVLTRTVPHVLTDAEVREKYPAVAEWQDFHGQLVNHFASLKGFSVRAASGMEDDEPRRSKRDSSAGTDKKNGAGGQEAEPRWR